MKKIELLGIHFSNLTMKSALNNLKLFLKSDDSHMIFTPNAEITMAAQRDDYLKKILNSADMLIADGAGVVLSSKILKKGIPEKIPGFDLIKNSLSLDIGRPIKYFLFGGKPGTAEKAAEYLLNNFPKIEISGCQDGYFKNDDEEEIINRINSLNVDILLVALGAPKQEKWIFENIDFLNPKICIGCGGTIDIFAGIVPLTPSFLRNNGLEWLYRLYKEPRRYKRMLDLPRFILLTLAVKFKIR